MRIIVIQGLESQVQHPVDGADGGAVAVPDIHRVRGNLEMRLYTQHVY